MKPRHPERKWYNSPMKKAIAGFTVVELTIVIIVIAVLAGLTTASYAGYRTKINDDAVQAQINNYGAKITDFRTFQNRFPNSVTELNSLNIKVSPENYATHVNGLMYCLSADRRTFAIAGASRSGVNGYYFTNTGGLKQRAWWNAGNPCSDFGIATQSGLWAAWTPPDQPWNASRTYTQP